MAKPKPAWIIHYQDAGQEDFFSVYLAEAAALKSIAETVSGYAQAQVEGLEWEEGTPASLLETINAAQRGEHATAIAAWEEFSYDYGPVDQTALLIDSQVMD